MLHIKLIIIILNVLEWGTLLSWKQLWAGAEILTAQQHHLITTHYNFIAFSHERRYDG